MRGPNSETKVGHYSKVHPLFEVSIIKVHWSAPVLKRSFSELVTGVDQYLFFVGPLQQDYADYIPAKTLL